MNRFAILRFVAIALLISAWYWFIVRDTDDQPDIELLNVSYDPTRDLWADLNETFIKQYQRKTGKLVGIKQSHGGSGSQARAVIEGLEADVVTLALFSDTDAIRSRGKAGLLADGWWKQEYSLPYGSTIVFVVRKGNPHGIKDWRDLKKSGVTVVTPDPKTSGNGKLSLLAAWAAVRPDAEARELLRHIYAHAHLDTTARASTIKFAREGIGDVHLTWENEAYLEVREFDGLEIVYPSASIKAEPFVAVVDGNVEKHGTREVAEEYLKFLYTKEGQDIIAKHHYRPLKIDDYPELFPPGSEKRKIELIKIQKIADDWNHAAKKFFGRGGIYDQIRKQ